MAMVSGNVVALCWMALAGALAGLAYWLRRGARVQHARWRVIATLPLEPRRAVHLVAIGDRRLVLGTGEQGLTLITELSPHDAALVHAEVDQRQPAAGLAALLGPLGRART